MDVSLTLVWSDSPLLLSYTRYLESGQQCSVVSTPLYNISFIWASLGGYGYSYPWYPPSPPSLPPSYPQLSWDAAETINWWIVLETDQVVAPGRPAWTDNRGRQGGEFNAAVNISRRDQRVHCLRIFQHWDWGEDQFPRSTCTRKTF